MATAKNEFSGLVKELVDGELKKFKGEIDKSLASDRRELRRDLESEIKNVTNELASAFGNNQIAKATTSAFGQAIGSVLSGKKVSARTIANAAARVLTPVFDDVFRKSGAQIADELRGFGNLSDRNS